jgi:hypothetical protein
MKGSINKRTSFSLLHFSRLIKMDIFLPSTILEASLLQHRQMVPLNEWKAPLSMASPEDIIKYLRQLAPLVGVADSLEQAFVDADLQMT